MKAEIRLFGSIRVTIDGQTLGARDFGGRKPKQLLEILVLRNGRHVAKERLAHLVWGDKLPVNAAGSLEHYVSVLRRRLDPGGERGTSLILTDHGGYRFDAGRAWVDLAEFGALYDAAITSSDRPAMERALALVTDDLLEDEPYSEWAQGARFDNDQQRLRLHVATGELALAEGNDDAAAEHAKAALALDRLDEAAVRLLMTASYRAGEQSRALRAFEQFRRALAMDVGVEPMPATRAVQEAVLRQGALVQSRPAAEAEPQSQPQPQPEPDCRPTPHQAAERTLGPALPAQRRAQSAAARAVSGVAEPRLVGRDREIDACLALLNRSQAPGLRSVLVDGELGVGKTALLDELARRTSAQRTVRVTCTSHGVVDGGLLEEVLAGLVGPDAGVDALLDGIVDGRDGDRPLSLPLLRELDLRLAAAGPFAVLLDDAHLADERSLLALLALSRRRTVSQGTVVLAADLGRAAHGHPLHELDPDLRVSLEPLTREELLALGVPDLHERTGGLPLLVAGCAADGGSAVNPDVAQRVVSRLRGTAERTWAVLVACAMASGDFGPEEVARLAGLNPLEVAEAQERLCRERVLAAVGEAYRFRYPLVRQIVRDTVSAGRRRLLEHRIRSIGKDRRRDTRPAPDGPERRAGRDRRTTPPMDLANAVPGPMPG
jgi:DNA-binding SARP family transcriptional activator